MRLQSKGTLVLAAIRKGMIASNATLIDAEPQSIEDALNDLEMMMAEWQTGNVSTGIDIGYLFTDEGDEVSPDEPHGLPDFALNAVILNLATRIVTDYGYELTATFVTKAAHSKELLLKWLAGKRMPKLQYPSRMPVGSGNQFNRIPRYYPGRKSDADSSNSDN